MLSWPGLTQVASVTIPSGTAGYLCSDTHGNVFALPAGYSGGTVYEYAHGGTTPVAELSDAPPYGGTARGCSVDSTSENLAVTNIGTSGSDIAIYAGASGSPAIYQAGAKLSNIGGCGYDADGNLYIVGQSSKKTFALAKLPNGSSSLVFFKGPQLSDFGHVQWVRGQMYVESPGKYPTIYHIKVKGSNFTIAGTTTFQGPNKFGQAWIYKNKIVAPFYEHRGHIDDLGLWKFPAGGESITMNETLGYLQGVTISVAP